jgi:hypothetical protein
MLRRAIAVINVGFAFALMSSLAGFANAAVIWDEAVNGPLGDFNNQTQLGAFNLGDNEILGTTGQGPLGVFDRDYFSFAVPAGLQLTALKVLNAVSAGPMGTSFIGIGAGTAITVPPTPTPPDASFLLGWRHYSPADIGTDILAAIGNPVPPMGAAGFVPPLGAGNYAIWIQDTALCTCTYGFDFVLAAIPEPASSAGILTGLAVLVAVRRARRQRA